MRVDLREFFDDKPSKKGVMWFEDSWNEFKKRIELIDAMAEEARNK